MQVDAILALEGLAHFSSVFLKMDTGYCDGETLRVGVPGQGNVLAGTGPPDGGAQMARYRQRPSVNSSFFL
jgi:hypothetical protein